MSSEYGAHFILFGGASLGSKRYMRWNFVSSSKERIEQSQGGMERLAASTTLFRATTRNSSRFRKAETLQRIYFRLGRFYCEYDTDDCHQRRLLDSVNSKPATPLLDKVKVPADLRLLPEVDPPTQPNRAPS